VGDFASIKSFSQFVLLLLPLPKDPSTETAGFVLNSRHMNAQCL